MAGSRCARASALFIYVILLWSLIVRAVNIPHIDPDYDPSYFEQLLRSTQSNGIYPTELTLVPAMFSIGETTPEGSRLFNAILAYTHTKERNNHNLQTVIERSADSLSQLVWSAEQEHETFIQIMKDMLRAQNGYNQFPHQSFFGLWGVLVANTAISKNLVYFQSFADFGTYFCKYMTSMQAFLALHALTSLPYFEQVDRAGPDDMFAWSDDVMNRLRQQAPDVATSFDENGFMPMMMFQRWTHSLMTADAPDDLLPTILTTWLRNGANLEALTIMSMTILTRFSGVLAPADDPKLIMEFLTVGWHREYQNVERFALDVQQYVTAFVPQQPVEQNPSVPDPAPAQQQLPAGRWAFLRRNNRQ